MGWIRSAWSAIRARWRPQPRDAAIPPASGSSVQIVTGSASQLPPQRDLGPYLRAYHRNVVYAACVDEVATSYAEPPLMVMESDGAGGWAPVAETDQVQALLEAPFPERRMSAEAFRLRLAIDIRSCGNAMVQIVRSRSGLPVRLWPLRIDLVKLRWSRERGLYLRYGEMNCNSGGEQPTFAPYEIPWSDVLHIKVPDNTGDFWGKPPTCLQEILMDDDASAFVRSYWENDGVPGYILKLKKITPKTERERIEDAWADRYGRTGKRVAAVDADFDVDKIGSTIEDLRLQDIFGHSECRICVAHQVPVAVVGVRIGLTTINWASYRSARDSFQDETMVPFFRWVGGELTEWATREFGYPYWITSDLTEVMALREDLEKRRRFALDSWNAGAYTLDEFRAAAGLPLLGGTEGMQRKTSAQKALPAAPMPPPNGKAKVFEAPVSA